MKMQDRERVEGTKITIGRRVYRRKDRDATSKHFSAEYRDETGKQVCEDLHTTSRLEARRKAVEIHARMQNGQHRVVNSKLPIDTLVDAYFQHCTAKGSAPKTISKYRADLQKLKQYCEEQQIRWCHRFTRGSFFGFREWLMTKGYADKTVYGELTLAKQAFKWGHHEKMLRENALAGAKLAKANAKPQPCFSTDQVDLIIANTVGVEKAAFATLGYAGLRIGEVEQMRWSDVQMDRGELGMFYVRRSGSRGVPKDKDERFVPIHPVIRLLLEALPRNGEYVFPGIRERTLLKRLKALCQEIGLSNPQQYKLHSFRHHFASLCANHQVAHRKALSWMGHSSSQILDLYYHLTDDDSQQAMKALAADKSGPPAKTGAESVVAAKKPAVDFEGELRARGQSKLEKTSQATVTQQLVDYLLDETEREGFEPSVMLGTTPVFETGPFSHSGTSPAVMQPMDLTAPAVDWQTNTSVTDSSSTPYCSP